MGFFDILKKVYDKSYNMLVEASGQYENYQIKVSNKSDTELVKIIRDPSVPTMLRSAAKQEYESRHN